MRNDVTFAPQWIRDAELDLEGAREDRMILVPRVLAVVLGALIGLALLLWALEANAQPQTVQIDCDEYAAFAGVMTTYRDVDANIDKVLAVFREANKHIDADTLRVFEAEARLVWSHRLPRADTAFAAHKRCQERLGQWPRAREG